MNWYLESGKNSDVAKSTRIRLIRNLNGIKFQPNTEKEIQQIE